jgi:hypothetical protein
MKKNDASFGARRCFWKSAAAGVEHAGECETRDR